MKRFNRDVAASMDAQNNNNKVGKAKRAPSPSARITIACEGHLIGWEDIIRNRLTTVSLTCYSNIGTLLSIRKEEFLQIIQKDAKFW